jgi:hypothetical protein
MSKIYVIHENEEWTEHLFNRLDELNLPYEDWLLNRGTIDLTSPPPEGIFYNRMSASAHTRGNRFAPELTSNVLAWLEHHERTVINGSRAIQLEVSKVLQYLELEKFGVKTPRTVAAVGKEEILQAADKFQGRQFITKHNRAGKGLGVQLFETKDALKDYVEGDTFEEPVDGITLLQDYIEAPAPYITRCEFVGGKFIYAVRVNTSEGFELCPADACVIDGESASLETEKFQIRENFYHPIIEKYEEVLAANDIQIAAIEFIEDKDGELYTYDLNTNTNYNADAEAASGKYGMLEIAKYLGKELEKHSQTV